MKTTTVVSISTSTLTKLATLERSLVTAINTAAKLGMEENSNILLIIKDEIDALYKQEAMNVKDARKA